MTMIRNIVVVLILDNESESGKETINIFVCCIRDLSFKRKKSSCKLIFTQFMELSAKKQKLTNH